MTFLALKPFNCKNRQIYLIIRKKKNRVLFDFVGSACVLFSVRFASFVLSFHLCANNGFRCVTSNRIKCLPYDSGALISPHTIPRMFLFLSSSSQLRNKIFVPLHDNFELFFFLLNSLFGCEPVCRLFSISSVCQTRNSAERCMWGSNIERKKCSKYRCHRQFFPFCSSFIVRIPLLFSFISARHWQEEKKIQIFATRNWSANNNWISCEYASWKREIERKNMKRPTMANILSIMFMAEKISITSNSIQFAHSIRSTLISGEDDAEQNARNKKKTLYISQSFCTRAVRATNFHGGTRESLQT